MHLGEASDSLFESVFLYLSLSLKGRHQEWLLKFSVFLKKFLFLLTVLSFFNRKITTILL